MDDELIQVLTNTQSPDQPVRQQAELALNHAKTNPAFPVSLANVAAHTSVDTAIRQAALSSLRQFIEANWNPEDGYGDSAINISEEAKGHLRRILLELTLSPEENRKVKISSRYAPLPLVRCASPQPARSPTLTVSPSPPAAMRLARSPSTISPTSGRICCPRSSASSPPAPMPKSMAPSEPYPTSSTSA